MKYLGDYKTEEELRKMALYDSEVMPQNYKRIHDLSDVVSRAILARKIPQPDHIEQVLGDDALKPYYFMHALMHLKEYGRRRWVLDYARRDQKAIQVHSYDSAVKPFYRLNDEKLPSGYLLTQREIKGILVHDLGEEFGKSLLGALVVNDVIRYLLGEEIGKDAGLLTNSNALLLDSLESAVKKLPDIDPNGIYGILGKRMGQINVAANDVQQQYRRIIYALRSFRDYIRQNSEYMPMPQKRRLLGIIDDMHNAVSYEIEHGDILEPGTATRAIMERHQHVMEIISKGRYVDVDRSLLLPGDLEFLLTLKKTLYRDYLSSIAGAVGDNANANSQNLDGDGYLAPMMEKLAESTNTVANMDRTPITHATSIFRKARALASTGIELAGHLTERQVDCQRLQNSIDYLVRNLDAIVRLHLESLERLDGLDDNWDTDLTIFRLMRDKMLS